MQIALITDNNDWNPICAGVVQDLVADDFDHVKAQLARNRVHQDVAVNIKRMFAIENREFILSDQKMERVRLV